jgi:MYXO-CTERM domain-containing protein
MVSDELHMMTVGFRSKGDMRLLAHGRTSEGWTPRIDVEWSTLFPTPTNDAGADAEPPDAPISMDATADSESEIAVESGADSSNSAPPDSSDDPSNSSDEPSEGGCGCKVNGSPSTRSWYVFPLGFLALGVFAQRRRGGCAIVDRG